MAIRPDFDIGTLTLTSGSADFTTSGSALEVAKVSAGDAIIAPSGHVLIIASITGQNSGTLFLPCPAAAAGTDLPLRIRFQPDGSRYQGAVRNLIDLLSSGNLEAFAALVGASGMVPIFTGPGTMDLADPATFGIQDPNGSLGKLAALTLLANKFLNTNGSGALVQSDIAAAAIALLNLSGTAAADQLPYLTGANGAGLTALTSFARTVLDDTTGTAMFATMGATGSLAPNGWAKLPNGLMFNWGNINIANGDQGILFPQAFPNQIFTVVIGASQSTPNPATTFYGASADSYTLSSFAAHGRYIGNGGTVGQAAINAAYLAIGR
ncbi:gp53-like domain-containing protein [Brucella anthropi]